MDHPFPSPDRNAAERVLAEHLAAKAAAEAAPVAQPVASMLAGLFESRPAECDTHGAFISRRPRKASPGRWSGCLACADEMGRAREQIEAERAQQERQLTADQALQDAMGLAAIPQRLRARSFADYEVTTPQQRAALATCRAFAEDFEQHYRAGTGLILAGTKGTGKGHLSASIQMALLANWRTQYLTARDLILAVRDTWAPGAAMTERQALQLFGDRVQLLVIDEIGASYGSDGERQVLNDVIDARYRNCRPTILCTNLNQAGMAEAIGDRAFDRLLESCKWVSMAWDSYRQKARNRGVN